MGSSALKFKGSWTASGWEIARDKRNPRILVARTMNILGNYGRAYLTVSFVVSRISCMKYSWRLHSEENYDFLSLYVNGVKKINITGHLQHWQSRQVQLSSGEKTLSWVYQKDSGYSSGTDRAWVVNIRLVRGKCLVPVIRPDKCDSSWKDQDGYGCDTYKKHQWCTASGHYGKNWDTWQFYKMNGKTALTCPQCGCKSNCDPNWKDAHGLSCSEYQKLKICTPQGGYGAGWANLTFADFSDCYGRTAKVCPQCGCKEPRRYDWSSALKFKGSWTASGWEIARDKRNPRILVARTMNILGNYGRAYLTVSFVVSRISCMKYSWR